MRDEGLRDEWELSEPHVLAQFLELLEFQMHSITPIKTCEPTCPHGNSENSRSTYTQPVD